MKDRGLFLFSLIISIVLSIYVSSQSNTTAISINVPIEARNVPPSKIILLPIAPKAQVSIRGPSYLLSDVTKSPPVFRVKFPSDVENRIKVQLTPAMLELPTSVEITSIEPGEVEFILDEVIEQRVEVVVPKIGQVPRDAVLDGFDVSPTEIVITGPRAEIENLSIIETDPVDLRDVRESFTRTLGLRQPGTFSKLSLSEVTASIRISKAQRERSFQGLEVQVRASNVRQFSVTPKSVNVEVTGPIDAVAALKPSDVVPFISIDQAAKGGAEATVSVTVPKSVTVVYVNPERVKLVAAQK